MATFLLLNKNYIHDGLGTLTYTAEGAGIYNVACQSTFTPASSLAIAVKRNGVTQYTAPAVTPTQSALQFKTDIVCTGTETVTVVLSSAAAVDNLLNSVQSNISIGNGV